MDYILIPVKDKTETDFFMDLFKKMKKNATKLSADEFEDMAFMEAIREGEQSGAGSLNNVKKHLLEIIGEK
jgi:PHD/YefM family antitoxin component YafN of YafNO toxin-antitoxin module